MTVTRLGAAPPLLTSGFGSSTQVPAPVGAAGTVVTSNGSNGDYWGENIARITANGSNANPLVGPFVNISAGSNIVLSWASNSLTIHGQAGGGGGTILTANGSNSLSAVVNLVAGVGIALGVSGQNITITNTGVPGPAGSSTFSGARAYNSAAQTVTAGVETAMTFDSEEFDTDTFHSTSTNTSRLTIPTSGKYLIHAHLGFAGSHGVIFGRLKKNGTTFITGSEDDKVSGTDSSLAPTALLDLVATDYIEVFAFRTTGTTVGATTNSFSNVFEIAKQ